MYLCYSDIPILYGPRAGHGAFPYLRTPGAGEEVAGVPGADRRPLYMTRLGHPAARRPGPTFFGVNVVALGGSARLDDREHWRTVRRRPWDALMVALAPVGGARRFRELGPAGGRPDGRGAGGLVAPKTGWSRDVARTGHRGEVLSARPGRPDRPAVPPAPAGARARPVPGAALGRVAGGQPARDGRGPRRLVPVLHVLQRARDGLRLALVRAFAGGCPDARPAR